MRWGLSRRLAACCALLWWAHAAFAAPAAALLHEDLRSVDAQALARTWVDPRADASLPQVLDLLDTAFQAPLPGTLHHLPGHGALWLHLRLQHAADERQDWLLKFPMPSLDLVTVYQQHAGQWRGESAGDTLAAAQWPERGRYPVFHLLLPPGETRDVLVRIQHATPADFPVQLATEAKHAESVQGEYLALGGAFGALLLLIAGCLATGWVYRDPGFAWYAGYAALTSLAVASYTGVAGQFLWPRFGALQDWPTTMLACAAVGAAMLFVRKTLGLRRRLPWLDRLTLALGAAGFALVLLPVVAAKPVHLPVIGSYLCLASAWAVLVAAIAWSRGDVVARWVFAAELPMVLALLASVFRLLGWADLPFVPQYAVVLALAIEVPLLLVALLIRTRDRHGAEVRAQALSTQDALTGLLAPHLFTDRLQQAVTRFRRDGEAIQESLAAQLARMSPRTRPPSASSSPSRRLRRNREIRRCSRKPIPATTRATPRSASRTGSSRARAGRRAASLPCRRR
jgi:two-component system, sensor histidine kinase LadS